jgi:hypothetical protein
MDYNFTTDWFTNNLTRWNTIVVPYLNKLGRPIKAMEIGVFEGRSALWTTENILADPNSKIWLVDDWNRFERGVPKFRNTWKNFLGNLAVFRQKYARSPKDKIMVVNGVVADTLKSDEIKKESFDFIYVDQPKDSRNLMEVLVLSWPLLKKQGLMVVDDYTSSREHDGSCNKQGMDAFMDLYAPEVKVIHMSWQVMLVKREKPLRFRKVCHSEYYMP